MSATLHTPLMLQSVDEALAWLRQHGVTSLTVDSRAIAARAQDGVGFIAWPGAARDGRGYVQSALNAGAKACLVEADGVEVFGFKDERIAALKGLKAASAEIAHGFYGEPSKQLQVVAVTGTNGKTSTSWWTAQVMTALGRSCGVVGTLGVGRVDHGEVLSTGLTTPDPVTLHATFRQFVDQGLHAAAIEASSIGIEEMRLYATHIAVAQFTNFTQDHLDYHGDMESYWAAKRELFNWHGLRAAVVNLDDPMGAALCDHVLSRNLDLWTYGVKQPARLQASDIRYEGEGVSFKVNECDATGREVLSQVVMQAPVIGDFNVSNLLAVVGALRALGAPLDQIAQACRGLRAVPGRMQIVRLNDQAAASDALPLVVVDYAHTPDALQKALEALRPVVLARQGRLWCVFGCGGNRDPIKRPLMGAVADQYADQVVLTSDNPRDEVPAYILSQILAGVARREGVDVFEDRRAAIGHAVSDAHPSDVVLIAGKGHESTQEVLGVKSAFSDVDEALNVLRQRLAGANQESTGGQS